MSKDYYKILNLSKGASQDEVKRSFRELAHKHHPDKGGDAEKFKELNEAYQVLGNAEKRQQYDQYGTTFDNMGAGGGGNPFSGFGGFGQGGQGFNINMDDLGDIMGDFFGGGGGGRRGGTRAKTKARGADIEMNLNLSFRDSIFGGEKILELYKNAKCEVCAGSGAEPGSKINTCTQCNGSGKITRVQNTVFGNFQTSGICPRCAGEGSSAEKLCKQCNGAGIRKKSVTLKVNIPAGIEDGAILRVSGGGEGARGGTGDLYLHINVASDKKFTREGENIITKAPLDFKTAALGGYINVETLDGEMRIKIPEGTESGQVFRLRGKGVAGIGDLLVHVYITVPKKLSKKQKKLLEEWED
jgi:molecular chaperone DnaJ